MKTGAPGAASSSSGTSAAGSSGSQTRYSMRAPTISCGACNTGGTLRRHAVDVTSSAGRDEALLDVLDDAGTLALTRLAVPAPARRGDQDLVPGREDDVR